MTYTTPIMADIATKDLQGFTHSAISREFSRMLTLLGAAIEMERDTEEVDVFDIAFKNWLDAAEDGWQHVSAAMERILAQPPVRCEDTSLQHLAFLIQLVLGFEDRDDCAAFNQMIDYHGAIFRCKNRTPVGRRTNRMIETAIAHYRTLNTMIFRDELDNGDLLLSR